MATKTTSNDFFNVLGETKAYTWADFERICDEPIVLSFTFPDSTRKTNIHPPTSDFV